MIDRVVLLKLRDELATPAGRAAIADELAARPEGLRAEIGLPADPASARSWDLALRFSFEHAAPLETPPPEAALVAALGDRLVLHKAWSFERRR